MESSQFTNQQLADGGFERLECQGATSETYCVKLYGKLHFVKRLKAEHVNDVRYQEAFQKEFETLQIANRLIKNYPNIPESTIRQDCESRFQHLVASVFNQMRQNGSKTSEQ